MGENMVVLKLIKQTGQISYGTSVYINGKKVLCNENTLTGWVFFYFTKYLPKYIFKVFLEM